MPQLYRRHRKECGAGHPEDSKSGQFEEGRRGWKRCASPIHASGAIADKFSRQPTGECDWDDAKAACRDAIAFPRRFVAFVWVVGALQLAGWDASLAVCQFWDPMKYFVCYRVCLDVRYVS
jgi:hypothetical protein